MEDFEKLLELKRANKFEAAFVVVATSSKSGYSNRTVQTYVAHTDAENFSANLKSMPLVGHYGPFWVFRNSTSAITLTLMTTTFHIERIGAACLIAPIFHSAPRKLRISSLIACTFRRATSRLCRTSCNC